MVLPFVVIRRPASPRSPSRRSPSVRLDFGPADRRLVEEPHEDEGKQANDPFEVNDVRENPDSRNQGPDQEARNTDKGRPERRVFTAQSRNEHGGQEDQRDDVMDAMKAFETQFPKTGKEDAVLVMAHGTPDPSNAYYAVIQTRLDRLGKGNAHVYTVEGWPSLEDVMPMLKEKGIKNVTLMPLMMVAGDHANNDMAGDEEDSHKNILLKNGFHVNTYIHGLGENAAVRQLFVDRALESWNYLEAMQEGAKGGMHQ